MATISGGSGDDSLHGTSQNDSIYGGGGNDTIVGAGGGDLIYGGDGNDTIYGDLDSKFRLQGMEGNLADTRPIITALANGDYVVAWQGMTSDGKGEDIFVQRFSAEGVPQGEMDRITANPEATGQQMDYNVEMIATPDGGFALTWVGRIDNTTGEDIYVQRYDAAGERDGDFVRLVGPQSNGQDQLQQIALLDDGSYVISWQNSSVAWGSSINVQQFAADGTAMTGVTQFDGVSGNAIDQNSVITPLADGGYIVTWESHSAPAASGGTLDVAVQRFDSNGNTVGGIQRLGTPDVADLQSSAIALADGGYVISWSGMTDDGNSYDIFVQQFDADGLPAHPVERLAAGSGSSDLNSSMIGLPDGGYFVAWTGGNPSQLAGQRFDANGDRVGDMILRSASTGTPSAATPLADGGFVLVWGDSGDIRYQVFDDQAAPVSDVRILQGTAGSFSDVQPQVAALPGGGFAITWSGATADGQANDIFVQQFDANGDPADVPGDDSILAGDGDDLIHGGAGNDYIWAEGGNDTVYGGSGADSVEGGAGADLIYGGDGDDQIWSGADNDTVYGGDGWDGIELGDGDNLAYGGAGNDIIFSGTGNDTIYGDEGDDQLVGGPAANQIFGGDGADTVWAQGGDDTVYGGGGSDTVYGEDGDDLIYGGSAPPTPPMVWAIDDQYNLIRIDMVDGVATPTWIGATGDSFSDIALAPDGTLYGVTDIYSGIFRIDTETGESTLVDYIPTGSPIASYGLEIDSNGTGYLSSANVIMAFDPTVADMMTTWWTAPAGITRTEDMVFSGNALYTVSLDDEGYNRLIRIDTDGNFNPTGHEILGRLPDGITGIAHGPDGSFYLLGGDQVYSMTAPEAPVGDGTGEIPVESLDGSPLYGNYLGATAVPTVTPVDEADAGDSLEGGAGNDTIFGLDGNDTVYGDEGMDLLHGGEGDDSLFGGADDDTIHGDAGNDLIAGGTGNDRLIGGAGDDTVTGNEGDDWIDGGAGADSLDGGSGKDTVLGGAGNDTISGGTEEDLLYGGTGDDVIDGGTDNDTIYGGSGSDTIDGGDGDDLIRGGGSDQGPTVLYANDEIGNLIRMQVIDGVTTQEVIGNTGVIFGDIGMAPDGTLYGVGMGLTPDDTHIYRIDTETAAITKLGALDPNMPSGANSLSFDKFGNAYAAMDSTIWRFDPEDTSTMTPWWTDPDGGYPAGDFVFMEDAAYIAWGDAFGDNYLIRIGIDEDHNPLGHEILGQLPSFAFGMTLGGSGTLYVLSEDGIYHFTPPTEPIDGGAGAVPVTLVEGSAPEFYYYGATANTEAHYGAIEDSGDLIEGGNGNDTIYGDGGDDTLYGGTGNNLVYGGEGADHIYITDGKDTVYGGDDRDTIYIDGDNFFGSVIDGDEGGDDFDTLDLTGWNDRGGTYSIERNPDNHENGTVYFFDGEGNPAGEVQFSNIEAIICFARGTLIRTPRGERRVEDLVAGRDHVLTMDNGAQRVEWIGHRRLSALQLALQPELRPIRIRQGALGSGLPEADLLVSPQHRVLVRSKVLERMIGSREALVAAKQLLGAPGIEIAEDLDGVEYWHFLCSGHEVVWSNGAQSETLYTGREALKSLSPAARQEVFTLFPELAEAPAPAARHLLSGRQGRRLTERHVSNGMDFITGSKVLTGAD